MSQISKCPRVTVILSYWEASGEVSKLRYKSLLYCVSVGSYCNNEANGSFLHCFMITWWLSYFPCLLNMTSSEWRYKIRDKNYFKLLQTFAFIKRKHFAVRMVLIKPSFQTEYAVLDKADLLWRKRPRWNCSSYSCLCCGSLPRWEAHTSDCQFSWISLEQHFIKYFLEEQFADLKPSLVYGQVALFLT